MSIYDVFVNAEDFEKAKAGDKAAVNRLADKLDGLVLYDHCYVPFPDESLRVSIEDLETIGVIKSVTCHKEIV